ncbi:hypothetical protein FRC17_000811 [Serendipita sp. 399]|nr:hypothetical protein FRC17_000811 [Serendipita sp. 399]
MDDEEGIPQHLIRQIDRAFDSVLSQHQTHEVDVLVAPPTVRRRRGDPLTAVKSNTQPGGFIPDEPQAGGFLVEDEDVEPPQPAMPDQAAVTSHLSLALVPAALQLLDLPPADEDVLQIFRNAAGGWGGSNNADGVSRKDFRSVCAILLANRMDESPIQSDLDEKEIRSVEDADEAGGDSTEDEYDDDEDFSDESDEDYRKVPGKKSRKKTDPPKTGAKRNNRSLSSGQQSLTRRQKAACRDAFSLFFPDVQDEDLELQHLAIKDIVRVSHLLKEKITAEEVIEMLEEFSTSPDKTMSYSDFQQMMISAKLA